MNILRQRFVLVLTFLTAAIVSSCTDKWADHNEITDPMLAVDLLAQINKDPDLSKFSEYLAKTGYDKVVASSKSFTVWAPTNQALAALDASVIGDDAKLKLFVGNHIANQLYLTTAPQPSMRIKTLNGKNVTFTGTTVEESAIAKADIYVGNGVIHVISQPIIPKQSIWEYLNSTSTLQKTELISLNFSVQDSSKAEQTGVDPVTGKPIYKPGTGIINSNRFLQRADISNEDSLYTYIVLSDAAFTAEKNKLQKYYNVSTVKDSTDSITRFHVIKDLAFKGVLSSDNFPGTVYSVRDSVKFRLLKSDVVETRKVSNGIVYVMSKINYDLGNGTYDPYTKIKPVLIQGENVASNSFSVAGKTFSIRVRRNPDGSTFRDLNVVNHGTAGFTARYRFNTNSVTYKVYWRVVRDYNLTYSGTATDLTWSPQKLAFKTAAATDFALVAKPGAVPSAIPKTFLPDYSEVLLGNYAIDKYYTNSTKSGAFDVYLVSNTTTTNGTNDLLLDYIKLVPILP
ncbi:fasciclin domain-containing protein [Hufsiella ginkgonis]|uniref:FAS1 domain-containing protein n=1 Tax=Hufsiella ginkgonis TaxID=2695274 RepID=A0A7K1Y2U6_9SPHI|nr:fasciclin domain-containing protein [Hufsiella ginkgonis]MXV17339.1 hypothetical protein [Hufsiella ginkgonis]